MYRNIASFALCRTVKTRTMPYKDMVPLTAQQRLIKNNTAQRGGPRYIKDMVLNTTSKIHPIVTILANNSNVYSHITCALCTHCPLTHSKIIPKFQEFLIGAKTWQLCNQPELLGKKLVNSRSHSLWYQSNVKLLLVHLHLIGI